MRVLSTGKTLKWEKSKLVITECLYWTNLWHVTISWIALKLSANSHNKWKHLSGVSNPFFPDQTRKSNPIKNPAKKTYCKNSLTGGESRLMSSDESKYSLLGLLTLAVVNACNEITKTTISPDRAIGSIRPFKENSKCILMTCGISSFCSWLGWSKN